MKERGAGAILNVSSVAGLNYFPGLMAYGMAKAALEHLTVSAAHQLRPFDIAVNTFRIDVPVASEGFVFNLPDADHSDWEPSEVAAEGIVWMLEQPPSYTGHNVGMAAPARRARDHGVTRRAPAHASSRSRHRHAPAPRLNEPAYLTTVGASDAGSMISSGARRSWPCPGRRRRTCLEAEASCPSVCEAVDAAWS